MTKPRSRGESTDAVHAGELRQQEAHSITTPIYLTSTFWFKDSAEVIAYNEGERDREEYGRYGNPTWRAVERKLSELEGGEESVLFASGMCAATTTFFALLSPGAHLVVTSDCYRRTRQFIDGFLVRFGVETTVIEPGDTEAFRKAIRPETAVFFTESPTNPFLRVTDIPSVSAIARERGVIVIVDSTFSTPINQRALDLGADLVLHSATKYLGGHNDLLAGTVTGSAALVSKIRQALGILGGVIDSHAAWLLLRGLKTLSLRMERHNNNGLAVARHLESHDKVRRVWYPGLASHPDQRSKCGGGGVVTFEIDTDLDGALRFVDATRVPYQAPSLGGVESLIELPVTMSFWEMPPEKRLEWGITDSLCRLACGIEDAADLVADVDRALESSGPRIQLGGTELTAPRDDRKAQNPFHFDIDGGSDRPPQEYYERIKARYAEQRDLRLAYRPPGTEIYTTELEGDLASYEIDPYSGETAPRNPLSDTVEVLFIGGGFSALLTAARLRAKGVESIRIVERGADVGGTWYWNRYPGVACDVVAYDYLPLLDETGYVPSRHYAEGHEIFEYCRMIAKRYDLYDLALFQTTVTRTIWNEREQVWEIETDRGDRMRSRFVVCANGTLSKPRLAKIEGIETFRGHSFHTSRWDYEFTGAELEKLTDHRVGIIGTGASAVQAVPNLAKKAKELYVFQRTPSSIDIKDDWETDPKWAASLKPGWQAERRRRAMEGPQLTEAERAKRKAISREEKIRRQENANIDAMMRIHRRIDEVVEDEATAEALKPWYMLMCKRPCFHNEYLPSFNRPNVHLVDTQGKGITEINESGVVFEDKTYELDLLIFATGFEVQKTGIYNHIVGERGLDLQEKYSTGIRTLFGIHTHGFPNLFIMGGYQASFAFNLTHILDSQGEHIAECIAFARDNGLRSLDVKPEAEEFWVQQVIANRGKTNRNKECTPGYYNFEGAETRRQDGNYNGSFKQYYTHMARAREAMSERFTFTTADELS